MLVRLIACVTRTLVVSYDVFSFCFWYNQPSMPNLGVRVEIFTFGTAVVAKQLVQLTYDTSFLRLEQKTITPSITGHASAGSVGLWWHVCTTWRSATYHNDGSAYAALFENGAEVGMSATFPDFEGANSFTFGGIAVGSPHYTTIKYDGPTCTQADSLCCRRGCRW
jgi:hypothetical protein